MIKRMMALTSSLLFVAGGTPWPAQHHTTQPGGSTTRTWTENTSDIGTLRVARRNKLAQPVHYAVSAETVMPLWQSPVYRSSVQYKKRLLNDAKPRPPVRHQPNFTRIASRSGAVLTVHIEGGDLGVQASSIALGLLGAPYRWGGESTSGFDCSGFVRYIYSRFGIQLPRTSYEQFQKGVAVSLSGLRPGDLVFFSTDTRGASHVALYIGNGLMVHALNTSKGVIVSRLTDAYYRCRFVGAKRL